MVEKNLKDYIIKVNILNHVQKLSQYSMKHKTHYIVEVRLLLNDKINNNFKEAAIWTDDKIYEDFELLNKNLKTNHPKMPKFPSKGFLSYKSIENLNKRKENLDLFLKECLNYKDILYDPEFLKFLLLDKYKNESKNKISKLDSFSNTWGVKFFIPFENNRERYLVGLCESSNFVKIDAYLNNLDYKGPNTNVSSVKVVRFIDNGFVLDKKEFAFPYNLQCGALFSCYSGLDSINKYSSHSNDTSNEFDSSKVISKKESIKESKKKYIKDSQEIDEKCKNLIGLGFTNGIIYILEDNKETDYLRLLYKFKGHKNKVFGLYFLDEQNLFTLGKDSIKVWEINTLMIRDQNKLCNKVSTSHFCNQKSRLTLGLVNGTIECYYIYVNSKIQLCEKTKLSIKDSISSLYYTSDNHLIAASEKGSIHIFSVIETYDLFNLQEKKSFKTNILISTIGFNLTTQEIILGDVNGVLSFIDDTGNIAFSKKINSNKITSIISFENIIIVSSKDKVVSLWKILEISLNDNSIKESSYGKFMIKQSNNEIDMKFDKLLSEPIGKFKENNKNDNIQLSKTNIEKLEDVSSDDENKSKNSDIDNGNNSDYNENLQDEKEFVVKSDLNNIDKIFMDQFDNNENENKDRDLNLQLEKNLNVDSTIENDQKMKKKKKNKYNLLD